jgi:pimeloyl-ACP methyl ester carboxylesterase
MSAPPILLLHGFPLDARMWDAQASALEQAGYQSLAPNLPGREPDNDLASWAGRVLQLLPGDFIPVGCSMGGYLIFELWRQASARIPAAVFIDTRAGADTPEVREGRGETITILGEDGFDAFWKLQEPKLAGRPGTRDRRGEGRADSAKRGRGARGAASDRPAGEPSGSWSPDTAGAARADKRRADRVPLSRRARQALTAANEVSKS